MLPKRRCFRSISHSVLIFCRGCQGEDKCQQPAPGANRDALLFEDLLQFTGLVHLADDVAAANELALDIKLRIVGSSRIP